jgi:hypothetical protein
VPHAGLKTFLAPTTSTVAKRLCRHFFLRVVTRGVPLKGTAENCASECAVGVREGTQRGSRTHAGSSPPSTHT